MEIAVMEYVSCVDSVGLQLVKDEMWSSNGVIANNLAGMVGHS
jgi:hypothetical protein